MALVCWVSVSCDRAGALIVERQSRGVGALFGVSGGVRTLAGVWLSVVALQREGATVVVSCGIQHLMVSDPCVWCLWSINVDIVCCFGNLFVLQKCSLFLFLES